MVIHLSSFVDLLLLEASARMYTHLFCGRPHTRNFLLRQQAEIIPFCTADDRHYGMPRYHIPSGCPVHGHFSPILHQSEYMPLIYRNCSEIVTANGVTSQFHQQLQSYRA